MDTDRGIMAPQSPDRMDGDNGSIISDTGVRDSTHGLSRSPSQLSIESPWDDLAMMIDQAMNNGDKNKADAPKAVWITSTKNSSSA